MDFKLSEEQFEFQKLAREFSEREIAPNAQRYDQSGEFAREIYQKAWSLGLMNVTVPEAAGGLGLGLWEACLIAEALAYGCSGIASAIEFSSIAQSALITAGSHEQKQKYLAPLNAELTFGGIEIDGFLSNAPTLKVKKKAGNLTIDGTCNRLLNASSAEWYVIAAKEGESDSQRFFVLPSRSAGIKIGGTTTQLGRQAADICAVTFQDVIVPGEAEIEQSRTNSMTNLVAVEAHTLIAVGMVGIAQAALDHAVRYANERKTFGKLIAEHQAVAFMIADMRQKYRSSKVVGVAGSGVIRQKPGGHQASSHSACFCR